LEAQEIVMSGKPHSLNGIGHFDIAGPDFGALQSFYSGVLGWQVTPRGPGYGMVATPEGGPDGALVEDETASLTLGIVVPDLAKALAATEAKGGAIAMPAVDNGWVKKAQVRDPAGNLLTLIQG
jgi:predicted enzyme related to lactoylglutathione lyase